MPAGGKNQSSKAGIVRRGRIFDGENKTDQTLLYCGRERRELAMALLIQNIEAFFDLPKSLKSEYLPLLDDWFISDHEGEVMALPRRREACDKPAEVKPDSRAMSGLGWKASDPAHRA